MKRILLLVALGAAASLGQASPWTYQGTLNDGGQPASGNYDMRVTVFDANGTRAMAAPVTLYDVPVSKGGFSVDVDFGVDFSDRHGLKLATEVRQGDSDFVSVGELSEFEPDGEAVCWGTLGNNGVPGAYIGTLSASDDSLLRLLSQGNPILYLRGPSRGIEQNNSLATGSGAAAWNSSTASGANSFTVGNGVTTSTAANSVVFADAAGTASPFVSLVPNQFLVRADGGVALNTASLPLNGDDLVIGARQFSGDADADLTWQTRSLKLGRIFLSNSNGSFSLSAFNLTGPDFLTTGANGAKLTAGGVWTNGSSRTFKQDFVAVDVQDVLNKVTALPISTWTYKSSPEGRHLGPMSEDFKAAFGLGSDAQHIATVDADGVALAAIQGLYHTQRAQNASLQAQNAALRDQYQALRLRLEVIEQYLAKAESAARDTYAPTK